MSAEEILREIKARMDAATPGPWYNAYHVTNHGWSGIAADASPTGYAASVREPLNEQPYVEWRPGNEDFVAHVRTDVEQLWDVAATALEVAGVFEGALTGEPKLSARLHLYNLLRRQHAALERLGGKE